MVLRNNRSKHMYWYFAYHARCLKVLPSFLPLSPARGKRQFHVCTSESAEPTPKVNVRDTVDLILASCGSKLGLRLSILLCAAALLCFTPV